MRKFLCLAIFSVAILFATQAVARSDKSIGKKCYKAYRSGRSNQGVACVYLQCQKKYEKYIGYQIQCLNTANREFLNLITKGQDKQEKNKRASNKKRSSL